VAKLEEIGMGPYFNLKGIVGRTRGSRPEDIDIFYFYVIS